MVVTLIRGPSTSKRGGPDKGVIHSSSRRKGKCAAALSLAKRRSNKPTLVRRDRPDRLGPFTLIRTICFVILAFILACVVILIAEAKTVKIEPRGEIAATSTINVSEVQNYVLEQAEALGVSSTEVAFIVSHESGWGARTMGDDGQSIGVFQISRVWHPEVPISCSESLVCSTNWALHWILSGHINQWTTWRLRCKLYPYDHPPGCVY
jgi:hypothetical protein